MPKRFRDTNIWNHDWYIELPGDYKLFWQYILDDCDCIGIWKPNFKRFEFATGIKIEFADFLSSINSDKERLLNLENGEYLLPGFISFQYGQVLSSNNPAHRGYIKRLKGNEISLGSLWGQIELKEPPKEKDKEKDTEREKEIDTDKESFDLSNKHDLDTHFKSPQEKEEFRRNDLSQKLYGKNFSELNEGQRNTVLKEQK